MRWVLLCILSVQIYADDWFPFEPKPETFDSSPIDLRYLNESRAGDGGFIAAKGEQFIHSKTKDPVRFWGVNGCPGDDPQQLRYSARFLAKYGVNLVRLHGPVFDADGNVDPAKVRHAIDTVAALKEQGIYSHLSIYFPLWLNPKPDMPGLEGYNGQQHPFAALFFNPNFQQRYRGWWKALLTTPGPDGKKLIDDPAVFGAEIINEDSYFFWTFSPRNIPDAQLKILEKQFGSWVKKRYGRYSLATVAWNKIRTPRDDFPEGRVGFRELWEISGQRTKRDQDTVEFLVESQRRFYQDTVKYLRELGFKGLICASNWATADPRVLGPLEKYTYAPGDFLDRHGYFGGVLKGQNASWSIQDGYEYSDCDALKFDAQERGKPRNFVNTIMDVHYEGKPSIVSEISFTRPNRYRSEAPLYYAAYGALQDSNGIVQYQCDSSHFTTKPAAFMQPWTLASPGQIGQFPAAALIYRKGLVATGETIVDLNLKLQDLLDLNGTPLPHDAAFDELRRKDAGENKMTADHVISPLCHYVGRISVRFSTDGGPEKIIDLKKYVDDANQTVTSTTGELRLDYARGLLKIDAPRAQGAIGNLAAGKITLRDMTIDSNMDLAEMIAVSLDGKPLADSQKILLQVMSEEKPAGWQEQAEGNGLKKILSIGHDPWMVKAIHGKVAFKRTMNLTALDANGHPLKELGRGQGIDLAPNAMYYVITP